MAETNLRIVLRRRPQGAPVPEDFGFEEAPIPSPQAGEVLLRHRFLSLDPYMRGRMSDAKSYAKPVAIGGVMEGQCVGEVVRSEDPAFKPGQLVLGGSGWQTYSVMPAKRLIALGTDEAPASTALGVLGMPGLTAWVGLEDIGQPKSGETVVVSAASGAVGAVVGQLAKARGARAVGVAGGAAKCRYVVEELGFAACVDYRAPDFAAQLQAACPDGVDVYWENVGGITQETVFPLFNDFGRMVMCGMVAQYNVAPGADTSAAPAGPNLGAVVRKRLRIQGFIVGDSGWPRYGQFRQEMLGLMAKGAMHYREDIAQGLRAAPAAFIGLLEGRNFGKQLVAID